MILPLWFVLGWILAWAEAAGRAWMLALPDPRVLVLVFVLLRTARTALPSRTLGLALTASAFGAGETGPWLMAVASTALLLFPVRRNLRVDHPITVLLATITLILLLLLSHRLGRALGLPLAWRLEPAALASLGTTLVAAPVFCELGARCSRWLPFLPTLAPDPADAGALRRSLPRPPSMRPGLGRPRA